MARLGAVLDRTGTRGEGDDAGGPPRHELRPGKASGRDDGDGQGGGSSDFIEGEEMGARGRGLGFRVRGSRLVGGGGGGVVDAWPVPWQMASTIPLSSCSEEGDELGGLGLL